MKRGLQSLQEVQLSEADAAIIAFARMPPKAPPVIRSALPRWEVRDGKLCEIVRTDRCFREFVSTNPVEFRLGDNQP